MNLSYLIFIFIIIFSLLFGSTFYPKISNEVSCLYGLYQFKHYYDVYQILGNVYYFIPIIFAYILIYFSISFARVKTKIIIENNIFRPYALIFIAGIAGFIIILIIIIISSNVQCSEEVLKDFMICSNFSYSDDFYFDSFSGYFLTFDYNSFKTYIELLLMNLIYIFINFLQFLFEILIIFYLDPNYILIGEVLYYSIYQVISLIYYYEYQDEISINTFIMNETGDILALIGYLFYLEIIEIRICKLNENLRENITNRSMQEYLDISDDNKELERYNTFV